MKLTTEAQKVGGVKVCKAEDVLVCGACGYDLDEAELKLSVCSDCGAPLRVRHSVAVWATSVPKAGIKTLGESNEPNEE
jgi:predicted amidophosphoribosyltransferase